LLLLLLCSSASAASLIPHRCTRVPAERLCAIHFKHTRTNHLRRRMQERPLAYGWQAEAHPARRERILRYWAHVLATTRRHWHTYQTAPWLSDPFHAQAICIHSKESTDWHEPGSPGGGMQFLEGTWLAWGGAEYAPWPSEATPVEQLRVAYRIVQHDHGWGEWSTAPLCGL
jgi:hypothetical protein